MQDVASPVEWLRWTYCLSCRPAVQVTAAPDPGAGKQRLNRYLCAKTEERSNRYSEPRSLCKEELVPEI